MWLIVENASSRLMWRCSRHITAPTSAVSAPERDQDRRSAAACGPQRAGEARLQYTRATPYSPSSLITPRRSRTPAPARPRARRPARSETARSRP